MANKPDVVKIDGTDLVAHTIDLLSRLNSLAAAMNVAIEQHDREHAGHGEGCFPLLALDEPAREGFAGLFMAAKMVHKSLVKAAGAPSKASANEMSVVDLVSMVTRGKA